MQVPQGAGDERRMSTAGAEIARAKAEGKGAELRAAVAATLEHWPELAWSNALSRSTCRRSRAYPSETLPYARSSFSALSRSSSRTVRRNSISSRV